MFAQYPRISSEVSAEANRRNQAARERSDAAWAQAQKMIILFENGVAELYDLKNDPCETRNLAKDPAYDDLIRKMITQARKMAVEEGDEVNNATQKQEKFLRPSGETPKVDRRTEFWTRFDQAIAKADEG